MTYPGVTYLGTAMAALALLMLAAQWGRATEGGVPVDLELVIAADVSTSMDREEKQLQQDGFVAAFRDARVHRAIAMGTLRRIAVIYVEWGGSDRQRVIVPWMLIDGKEAALAFADRLDESFPGRLTYGTNMGDLVAYSLGALDMSGFAGVRRVIDISGDGKSNRGTPLELARREAFKRGLTINGLPVVYREPQEVTGAGEDGAGGFLPGELVAYFLNEVIGGPGAFVVPVFDRAGYDEAIRAKLVREIAGEVPRFAAAPSNSLSAARAGR